MFEKRKRGRSMRRSRSRKVDNNSDDSVVDCGPTFSPDEPLSSLRAETSTISTLPVDFDIATLGTRTVTNMVEKAIVVGKTDLGKDVITMKMRPVTVTKVQPILNLEETLSLGKRDWQPFPPKEGHWFCHVEQKGQRRRFLIPEEIYQKVKDA